jgi:hypothetical protein
MRAYLMAAAIGCAIVLSSARAQQSPPASPPASREMPRPEELEPAVDTTHAPASSSSTPAAGAEAQRSKPSNAAPAPRPAAPAAEEPQRSGGGAAAGKAAARKGPDRLQLDTTEITGNRELPKVLYIVPWKRSDLGDLAGRPVNSLLDEVLQPLDRDVFRRENRYYDALKPGESGPKADLRGGSGDKP